MKYLLSVFFLAVASHGFAAIEFSEELDQFSAGPEAVSTVSDADAVAADSSETPSIRSAGNADASNAAVTSAQSTGVVGSMSSPLPLNTSGLAAGTIRGGGGSSIGVASEGSTDDLLAEAQGAASQRDGDTSSLMVDEAGEVIAMPEPATAVVWSLLAACGVAVYRRRK